MFILIITNERELGLGLNAQLILEPLFLKTTIKGWVTERWTLSSLGLLWRLCLGPESNFEAAWHGLNTLAPFTSVEMRQ